MAKAFEDEKDVVVARIDADRHQVLARTYGVTGFPTIKFFSKGPLPKAAVDYNLRRDPESFVRFLNEKAGTARSVLTCDE